MRQSCRKQAQTISGLRVVLLVPLFSVDKLKSSVMAGLRLKEMEDLCSITKNIHEVLSTIFARLASICKSEDQHSQLRWVAATQVCRLLH